MKLLLRWLGLVALAALALQLFFLAKIALMLVLHPQSTAFERSEAWRLATTQSTGKPSMKWQQQWVSYGQISDHLKRAVIASEDDGFAYHDGVDWDALEKAWQKNEKAQAQTAMTAKTAKAANSANGTAQKPGKTTRPAKVVGGSTITQQLAKNLFLSGERTLVRKGQEFVLTFMLEAVLDKEQILEIYLNHVEWGEGIFGAEAAAQSYFHKPAARLLPIEAARLAVMLPRPKYFQKLPASNYLAERSAVIAARMGSAELP